MTLPSRIFCDTSFFYACLDPADAHYEAATDLVSRAVEHRSDLVTTWDVISETATLLRYRASFEAAESFLHRLRPSLDIVPYSDEVRAEAESVFLRFGRERRLSYCDAIP